MHGIRRLGQGLVIILALGLAGSSAGQPAADSDDARVRVILELGGPPSLAQAGGGEARLGRETPERWERARQRGEALAEGHRGLLERARSAQIDVAVAYDLTAAYNGLVVDVPTEDLGALARLPGVRDVHRDARVTAALDVSVPLVRAPQVWQERDPDGRPAKGAGVVVAVLDTGIDYSHPDLGAGFGPKYRVVAGHDFVNEDGDPMDDNGHGTHVAGIVGADGAVTGVAPEASFTAYKVLGRFGSGDLSDVLAGLDAAVAPDNPYRAEVVNMSLSGPGDGSDEISQAAKAAVEAGIVVVAAAGNAGPGAQSIRSPGSAAGVLTVGASVSGVTVPGARIVAPAPQDLHAVRREFSANAPADGLELAVVDLGEGTPGTYDDVEVAGKAVLMLTSGPADLDKAAAAEARGALAAFFYIPDFWGRVDRRARPLGPAIAHGGDLPAEHAFAAGAGDGRLKTLVAMLIPGASAATLQEHLAVGEARVAISAVDATDQLASFSSRGPSGIFGFKPDLVAPGVEIRSTLPGGTYVRFSGTSMAAPHVAGAAALLRQLHPGWSAEATAAALTGSARRAPGAAPLSHGAGRLDAFAASRVSVIALPRALSFGLADLSRTSIERTVAFRLHNLAGEAQSATLRVEAADGSPAAATITPATVEVPAAGSVTVTAQIRLPAPRTDADVTGWVTVDVAGEGAVDLRVPYSLVVRHLSLHVSPDPVPAEGETTVFVSSPALLSGPPTVRVECPGAPASDLAGEEFGARIWRVRIEPTEVGVCRIAASGVADSRYGSPVLAGGTSFEVVAPARQVPAASHWHPIGPNAEGGYFAFDSGDRTRMAVVSPSRPSLFVTDDGMQSWRELRTMPLAGGVPWDVAVDPTDSDRIYVALNGGSVDPTFDGRLLLTEDGGKTWRILPAPDAPFDGIDLAPSGEALAVASDAGLLVTTDDFATSTQLSTPWSLLFDLHWIDSDLYVGTTSGLQRFRDAAGPNPVGPETLFRPPVLPWVAGVAGDGETILADSYFDDLYSSNDGGATFTKLFEPLGFPARFFDLELIGDDIYGVTLNGAWIGRDRGSSWESWGDPLDAAIKADIAPWPNPHPSRADDLYVSAIRAGIFAAEAPGEYERVGVPGAEVLDLAIAADPFGKPAILAGGPRDTYRTVLPEHESVDGADLEWGFSGGEGRQGATTRFLAASPDDPRVVWKVRTHPFLTFGIHRSDDGGVTWEQKASPSEFPWALLVHPADAEQVFVSYASLTGAGLVVTRDGGATWRKIDQGRVFIALAGDPTDPDRIWAGDWDGLWLSEDGGLSFRRVLDEQISAVAVDPENPGHVVAGGRRLYVSRDEGAGFEPAALNELDRWISDLAFLPGDQTTVFASSTAFYDELGVLVGGRGVLRSDDGGASWSSFNSGLENLDVMSLAISPDGRHLFAGTLGGSVHRVKLSR